MKSWLKTWKRTEKAVGKATDPTTVVEWKNTEIMMEILEFQGIYQTTVAGTVVATDDPVAAALHQALEAAWVIANSLEERMQEVGPVESNEDRVSTLSLLYPSLTVEQLSCIDEKLRDFNTAEGILTS